MEYRLEVKTARLLRTSTLPAPTRQHRVGNYRLDFVWLKWLVAVECDGFETHGYRLAWKRDRRRIAALEQLGWNIVIVTWDDVTQRPAETLDRIALRVGRQRLTRLPG